MPIYEYRCSNCGKEYEVLQRITDPAVNACKFCHGPVEKLVSLSSFHLKGSGWYVTDYGGKKVPSTEGKKEETAEPSSSVETGKGKSTSTASSED